MHCDFGQLDDIHFVIVQTAPKEQKKEPDNEPHAFESGSWYPQERERMCGICRKSQHHPIHHALLIADEAPGAAEAIKSMQEPKLKEQKTSNIFEGFPEHEKLHKRKEEHQAIVNFCEFLEKQGISLSRKSRYTEKIHTLTPHAVIASCLGIDTRALHEEQAGLLEKIYKAAENAPSGESIPVPKTKEDKENETKTT